MKYPTVKNEDETLEMLRRGFSIARFGDGELKMIDGKEYVREPANPHFAEELRHALQRPHPRCIVGIPTFHPCGPKVAHWRRHERRFLKYLNPKMQYYSAFISRPDSAPWIRNVEFARKFREIWRMKKVAIVCEPTSGTLRAITPMAASYWHIPCPSKNAYTEIDMYESEILKMNPEIAFLSCGPTASCLANRLAAHGIQTIDFGSGGSFLAKLLDE